jgi:hypothetical protein
MNRAGETAPVSIAEANATLTGPGQLFEMEERTIRGVATRTWKHAPASLRAVLDLSFGHGDATFLVYEDDVLRALPDRLHPGPPPTGRVRGRPG